MLPPTSVTGMSVSLSLSYPLLSTSTHSVWKREIRQQRIAALDQRFSAPIDANDEAWLALSIPDIVAHANKDPMSARSILTAYGKTALHAQQESNCLTEFIFDDALPEPPADFPLASPTVASLPLHGVPISIKDCIDMVPYPSTLSYSRNVRRTPPRDAAIVRLLRDAGATMHVKSVIPVAAFGLETMSDIFGYTHNPWKKGYSAGASTGGGAALLAHQGSVIEVGTDIGGSLR
jgi:Asp-tRNA(Asn)/Glu-tRNA(Gln) amidotransferase A subunit family amidase